MAVLRHPLERWLFGLAPLLLLAGLPPGHAHGEEGTPPPETHQARETSDPNGGSANGENSNLTKEVSADGSRLFGPRPIWKESREVKQRLHAHGITYGIEMAFYDQYASRVTKGQQNFGTYSWRLSASWRFFDSDDLGSLFVDASLLGSPGLNYDPDAEVITRNVGSISALNGNIYTDSAALDEILVKYVSPSTRYGGAVGKIDLANRFDTNRIANDAFRQFTSFALENNLSIPWPVYGGVGAFVHADVGDHTYVMAATAASVVDKAFDFGQQIDDGNLYQLAEIGTEVDLPSLGTGHYRLTPWHAQILDQEGWGVGFNFDQELFHPDVVGFFRFGIGEPSATPIQTFVSGGLAWLSPWGRSHDMLGFGVAWSNPSPGQGFRNETLVEIFYRLSILPWFQLSPDLQVVFHPANDPNQGVVAVPGIRLNMSF